MRAAAYWPYYSALSKPGNDCTLCAQSQDLRRAWGCDGASESGPWGDGFEYDLGGYVTRRCPLATLKSRWAQAVLELYAHWERGITPNRELRRETAHYRDAMQLTASLKAESESWYMKQVEQHTKRGSK